MTKSKCKSNQKDEQKCTFLCTNVAKLAWKRFLSIPFLRKSAARSFAAAWGFPGQTAGLPRPSPSDGRMRGELNWREVLLQGRQREVATDGLIR